MDDWQQLVQSVFIGVVSSFLLAKLFSVLFAFHEEILRITRSYSPEPKPESEKRCLDASSSSLAENEALISGDGKSGREDVVVSDHSDSDEDWEGVEINELDEAFSAATAFVSATAADRSALKVSNDVQLQLYGLYKIATEGPCSAPRPSTLKVTARAKWQAWQKLGAMPPEEAMKKYIDIITDLYPTWAAGSATKKDDRRNDASTEGSNGPMGPVFSSFIYEEESGSQL
ncbi:Acyl-CoA-binding protein [Handroanthus impetiginosus]|uniref:Acyl-CoA-binding protein n=1 Tax=Handroanthus impetiginosus TaxID=429701 RepID=A0A2G9HAF8_9LAMI|nr:Acyl-CoA-binding protein [Handroanthus impetiginosus]